MSQNNISKKSIIKDNITILHGKNIKDRIDPLEIAKIFGAVKIGKVDYHTAKSLYHSSEIKNKNK